MSRSGPGLLARDLAKWEDPALLAAARVLDTLAADVILLTGVDYDHDLVAARLLSDRLDAPYEHVFALRPNTGMPTGIDMDGNGRIGGADDAQGWGRFSGHRGMVILSRLPIDRAGVRDFSTFLWADLPGALLYDGMPAEATRVQRLSSTGHWEVPVMLPDGGRLRLLAWHATPPAFGRPPGRNRARNHDETAFWTALVDGRLEVPPPEAPFVLLGISNLDPAGGDGMAAGIRALLDHPLVHDVMPRGTHGGDGAADSALDTAYFEQTGGLRVDLVVPSAGITVVDSGVLWPPADDPLAEVLAAASRHYPVWIDIALP